MFSYSNMRFSLILFITLLGLKLIAQKDCDSFLNYNWKTIDLNFNNSLETVFEKLDTINLHRYFNKVHKDRVDYSYLQLNGSDSTFKIINVDTIQILNDFGKKEVMTFAGSSNNGEGIFQLDTLRQQISFQLTIKNKWYTYNYKVLGSIGNNPYIISTSTGDYRYQIILFKEE